MGQTKASVFGDDNHVVAKLVSALESLQTLRGWFRVATGTLMPCPR